MSSVPENGKEINLPKEASLIFFFFIYIYIYFYTLYTIYRGTLGKCTPISSNFWVLGGPVERLPPAQDGKALNRPKPHPSIKTE